LPVSRQAEEALKEMGVLQLGELNGRKVREVAPARRFKNAIVGELAALCQETMALESDAGNGQAERADPLQLLNLIDKLLDEVPTRLRDYCLLRWGSAGAEPRTLEQIGMTRSVTKEAVRSGVQRSIALMRRRGGLRLRILLEQLVHEAEADRTTLSTTLRKWTSSRFSARHGLDFYVRTVEALVDELTRCSLASASSGGNPRA
jgi:hypothetical protein